MLFNELDIREKLNLTVAEDESKAIPLDKALEPIQRFDIIPYASHIRVMYQALMFLGCRISELDNFKWSLIFPHKNNKYLWIYWQLGKNQKTHRRELMPKKYYDELVEYRKEFGKGDKLFTLSFEGFRKYFYEIRPLLSDAWQKKIIRPKGPRMFLEYDLQLKGLRKNWATLDWKKNFDKYLDPTYATMRTSKNMRHSSKNITNDFYIQNLERLGLSLNRKDRFVDLPIFDIYSSMMNQSALVEFI